MQYSRLFFIRSVSIGTFLLGRSKKRLKYGRKLHKYFLCMYTMNVEVHTTNSVQLSVIFATVQCGNVTYAVQSLKVLKCKIV
jgi:hypothetical protein